MKKIIMGLLVLLMILSTSSFVFANENDLPFSDIKGHWAESLMVELYNSGELTGFSDGTARPDDYVTKAEFITFMNRAFNLTKTEENHYIDVDGMWYEENAKIAANYGYEITTVFRGDEYITRTDVAVMLYKLLNIDVDPDKNYFNDIYHLSSIEQKALNKFGMLGFYNGTGSGSVNPDGNLTRAELFQMKENIVGYTVKSMDDVENIPNDTNVTILADGITIENKNINILLVSPSVDQMPILNNALAENYISMEIIYRPAIGTMPNSSGNIYVFDDEKWIKDDVLGTHVGISYVEDLDSIRNNLTMNYVLLNDIDFNDDNSYRDSSKKERFTSGLGFNPLGRTEEGGCYNFTGEFVGNDKTIKNLYINYGKTESYIGLFGVAGKTSVIRNLKIESSYASGFRYVGLLTGLSSGGWIENCSVSGETTGYGQTGLLVGKSEEATIKNCNSSGVILASYETGGLVGYNYRSDIYDSYSTANVKGTYKVGGLTGYNHWGNIDNCYASGEIGYSTEITSFQAGYFLGGLSGEFFGGLISNSYATGNIDGINSCGGLVGSNSRGSIDSCYAIGDVDCYDNYAGGLVGRSVKTDYGDESEGFIKNSYATGNVSGKSMVGGLVGQVSGGLIKDCYAEGEIRSIKFFGGGLAGIASGEITGCYAIGDVIGTSDMVGGLVGESGAIISYSYSSGEVTSGMVFIHEADAEYIDAKSYMGTGGLVGMNKSEINNCFSTSNINGVTIVGGLVGNNRGYVKDSYASGSVNASNKNVSGLVGENYGTIENCIALNEAVNGIYANRLVGFEYSGEIINCYGNKNMMINNVKVNFGSKDDINGENISNINSSNKAPLNKWNFSSSSSDGYYWDMDNNAPYITKK